jgi:hypothetical protein
VDLASGAESPKTQDISSKACLVRSDFDNERSTVGFDEQELVLKTALLQALIGSAFENCWFWEVTFYFVIILLAR